MSAGRIAVALHDVEPATFERSALIRDWLADLGVERVTLLVIPARDLHPFDRRSPELAAWLEDRRRGGDAIAQHGFRHEQLRPGGRARQALARLQGGAAAEFVGLDPQETRRAVEAGRRILHLAGIEPRGFVAPAYAYTPALHAALGRSFDWWASLRAVHRGSGALRVTALGLGTSGPVRRLGSPAVLRLGARTGGELLRLDLHPADFDHRRHVAAIERVLVGSASRSAVTYDELVRCVAPAPIIRDELAPAG